VAAVVKEVPLTGSMSFPLKLSPVAKEGGFVISVILSREMKSWARESAWGPTGILERVRQTAMSWKAVRIGKDTRIAPRKSREMVLEFALPERDFDPIEVRSSIYYRRISALAAKKVGIKESPAIEIAGDRIQVFSNGQVEKAF